MASDKNVDCRPTLFVPQGAQTPLFFLHIPKTSGSSMNALLRSVFGPHNVRSHIENVLPALLDRRIGPLSEPCLSGHVPLWAWQLYRGSNAFHRVTCLRDPWARLVSHVNWVARYAADERAPPGVGGRALERIARLVVRTDFDSLHDLRTLMHAVKQERHFSSFDNYQVRMLRTGRMDAMEKRVNATDLAIAETELDAFWLVGFCEAQDRFQAQLCEKVGVAQQPGSFRVNTAKARVLSPDNRLAREVFAPWIEFDMALYGFARGRWAAPSGQAA